MMIHATLSSVVCEIVLETEGKKRIDRFGMGKFCEKLCTIATDTLNFISTETEPPF